MPSQRPSVPQLAAPSFMQRPAGSVLPAEIGPQVPAGVPRLQALQDPQVLTLQQTPSVQKRPLPHWLLALQVAPAP